MMVTTVNVAELKAHLSRYLRMASRGVRVVVLDRTSPVAELRRPTVARDRYEQLVADGMIIPATRDFRSVRISRTRRSVDIQRFLREVRDDAV